MDDFLKILGGRTSIRAFAPGTIDEATWEKLLRAAMAAPSAVNRQPWAFVRVEKRDSLEALAAALPYAKMAAEASAALVVCAEPARAFNGKLEYAVLDASAACENLLLAAHALGLGAVWTAVYPEAEREAAVRRILGIPEEIVPLALLPIGYPAEEPKPKDKYRPELIHRESW